MGHRIQLATVALIALLLVSSDVPAFDGRPLFGNLFQTAQQPVTQGRYFLALTKNTYNGSLGGRAGADAKCLSELKNNNWRGKDSGVLLNKTTVKAFLCDSSCHTLQANTGYVFTLVGDPSFGGASIYTNGSGVGPGTVGFGTTSLAWSGTYGFGTSANWWSGRSVGTITVWGSQTSSCTNWNTTGGSGQYGITNLTTTGIWSQGTLGCSTLARLVCAVTSPGPDDTPDPFDFTDATGATPNSLVETSQTVMGFSGLLLASVMSTGSGYLEVRKNGSGAWGPSVAIQAGETLNLRMLAPASSTTQTMSITLGRALVNWAVTSLDETVNAFTLPESIAPAPSTVIETSVVPAGYASAVTFTASGTGQVRKNGAGGWASSVSLSPGDTLNVRMTSSASVGGVVSTLVSGGGESATWYVTNDRGLNMFILSAGAWTGDGLSGLGGANAKCFLDLTNNNFPGKSALTLDGTTVKAFLCDSTTCQNPNPNTTYSFAASGNMSIGGATFTTNEVGMGPGNSTPWITSGGDVFLGGNVDYHTGRTSYSDTYWAPYPDGSIDQCVNWTNSGSGTYGQPGFLPGYTDDGRWKTAFASCGNLRNLICMVTSSPVGAYTTNAFSFTDTYTTPSTTVETSAVISGFTGTRGAGATGGQVRKNGGGAWGDFVTLSPGDTLNVRVTTSSAVGAGHHLKVFAGNQVATWNVYNQRDNFFVVGSTNVSGNLGGLAGANATCLSDLTTNNFQGKPMATLNASTVKAFLCDSTSCQMPDANKTYFFAKAGDTTVGGASFTSDADTYGPGDSASWASTTTFGSVGIAYWTGRQASASATLWTNGPTASTCSDWSTTSGLGSRGTNVSAIATRWNTGTDNSCGAATLRLICMVTSNPDATDSTPNAFTFTDVTGAIASTLYETSVVVSGFNVTVTASATNGAEVRKNGGGAWGSTVSIDSGDTLNVRMTSSSTPGASVSTAVVVGGRADTWNISNAMPHLLVMTSTGWNGSLGGLAGANTNCVNHLTANDFLGKSGVTVDATTVKAFLCDSTTCQNPRADKTHFLALAGSANVGGSYFTTNASGQGPNHGNQFSGLTGFGQIASYWTGRASTSALLWNTTPGLSTCSNWGGTAGNGVPGSPTSTTATRWTNTGLACTNSLRLLCLVRSNTPDTFTLANLEGATPSTVYETSTVIAGLLSPGFLMTSAAGAEIRKNGAGGWGTSVSVDNGDTLNIRMTSSSTAGGEVTGQVIAGADFTATWTITNFRENLFVITSSVYSNPTLALGNSQCLANLTAQNFKGKTGLTLDATTVKAFLCDTTGCQNPKPNTTFFPALAGSATVGGASFTTDGLGRGPGNSDSWLSLFGSSIYNYWTGRASTSSTLWSTVPSAAICGVTTTQTVGTSSGSDATRWSNGGTTCGSTSRYLCMVSNSPLANIPAPFSFPDTTAATPSTLYETSAVISGFTGTVLAEVTVGTGEIRVNGSGGWGTTATLSAGDTLNVRMTSSAAETDSITTKIQVGSERNADWTIRNAVKNLLVLTNTTYTGNLGGMAGANSACLTELTNNSFNHKSEFNLNASSVRAFLCSSSTCQTTRPSQNYNYATVGTTNSFGNFTTDSAGAGPGDAVAWSTRFGVTGNIWTGRTGGSANLYGSTLSATTCTSWLSTATTGTNGILTSTTATRWTNAAIACTNSYRLLCMVHGLPNPLSFPTTEGATPSTYVETSAAISGAGKANSAVTSSGGAEIRVNGTGSWLTSATVNNGDTLNVRMLSSATVGGTVTGTISITGGGSSTWTVRNLRENLFVVTSTSYNGNLGGLAGANSTCLTAVSGASFQGKTGTTINASTVKAFLCDDTTCQMPKPNSTYWFARAGDTSVGGASFNTGSVGNGPGNYDNWEDPSYFGTAVGYWTAISGVSDSFLPIPASGSTCSNWTSSSGSDIGGYGFTQIFFGYGDRWLIAPQACNLTSRLICMITSDPTFPTYDVDPFTVSDVVNAPPNSMADSSVVLTGSFSNLTVSVGGITGKLVRKNNGGTWATSVSVDPGDTLNIRAPSGSAGSMTFHYIAVGNRYAQWTVSVGKPQVFVLSDAAYPGNLGGLSGANAKCLSILQNGTFAGKTGLVLDSSTVSAFLCDSTTCQNPRPNKLYWMGRVGSTSGPASFTTNGSGEGPANLENWSTNLSLTSFYWTGRAPGTASVWSSSPGDGQCTNWSSSTSAISGTRGSSNSTTSTRWSDTVSSLCNVSRRLICMVRSNTPDTFTLATVNSASTSTVYETSAVISGLLSGGFTVTSSTEIEVRKNGVGVWGSSVSVDNGDTLNVRMTSASGAGQSNTGKVFLSSENPTTWTINNL